MIKNKILFFTSVIAVSVLVVGIQAFTSVKKSKSDVVRYYLSTKGDDNGRGTQKKPFATLMKVHEAVLNLKKEEPEKGVEVIISGGYYELSKPLIFTSEYSGTKESPVVYKAVAGEKVVISGGKKMTGWKNIGGNHWVVMLPDVKAGNWYFRQLWAGEKRLVRARIPNEGFFKTKGALTKYAKTYRKYTFNRKMIEKEPAAYWESRTGFHFYNSDIKEWPDWKDAEILTMHSWESSWQSILRIDTVKDDVYFNSPCRYPVGTFSPHMRYRIENIIEALDMPGEWYLNGKTGELHYLAKEGENPDDMNIHAPVVSYFLKIEGSDKEGKVKNIRFENITFKYAKSHFGIYDIAPDWPEEIKKGIPDFPDNPKPGYTDSQSAPRCGEAVLIEGGENIFFERCRILHVGAYALKIGKQSRKVTFNGGEMGDMGGGGVLIGFPVRLVEKAGIPYSDAPAFNVISNNTIHDAGLVHPASVGVWIAQSHDNKISHNEISNISYSGVSIGWTWGPEKNYTKNNLIEGNYIHHVAQQLGDAAGIYCLGNCEGTVYRENYLDEIKKGDGVYGVVDAMGFDEHSKNVVIERNVTGATSGKVVSFNRNGPKDHKWIDNNFDVSVERPVLENKKGMDSEKMTVFARFKIVSSFVNLHGHKEQRWIVIKNGNTNSDGFYGMVVEGKTVTGYLNIGGGKENLNAITSGNVMIDDHINSAAIIYDGNLFELYVNGKKAGEKVVGRKRVPGKGKMKIAPVSANCLRDGVERLQIFETSLPDREISLLSTGKEISIVPSYVWLAPPRKIADVDFNEIIKNAGRSSEFKK